jgi:hypothetical protein
MAAKCLTEEEILASLYNKKEEAAPYDEEGK